jgi:outer membrane autotransporter protein
MNTNFRKSLVLGTALVAVAAFAGQAQAADLTLTGVSTWGVTAPVTAPTAGDNVIMGANNLTINNTLNTAAGAITSTTGTLLVTDSASSVLTQTIGSYTASGAGPFTILGNDAQTANIAVTVTNALNTGGALSVTQLETSTADTMVLNVGGALTVSGTTTLTAGAFAAATSAITVTGNSAFTGAVTVTGGAGAGSLATLTLNGATNAFAGGLNLVTATKSILNLSGTTAQTVSGAITGGGDIVVNNASGATFSGAVTTGTITVEKSAGNSSATFGAAVTATSITLGGANTGDNTVTFDGTAGAFTVAGTLNGSATAAENNTVNVIGGNIITQSGIWGGGAGNVDLIAVSGNSTLNSDAAITATSITVASGSTIDVGAGLVSAPIVNNGTIQLTGVGGITGAITGTGLLDVNASAAISGAITQGTADIAAVTLTQSAASGYTVGSTNFSGAGTLALLGGNQTVTGNFTNTTDGTGTITISNVAGTTAFVGNVGTGASNSLLAFTASGATGKTVSLTGNMYADTITLNDASTLSFVGTGEQLVSGAVTDGDINVAAGSSAKFLSTVTSGDAVTVGTGSNLTFTGVTGLTSITNTGTTNIDANTTLTATHTNLNGISKVGVGSVLSALTFTDNGSYVLKANDANGTLAAADFGSLTDSGGGVATLTAANLSINVTGNMGTGTVLLLTNINTGAVATALTDDSVQYNFSVINNGGNTDVTVSKTSAAALATAPNVGVAGALDSLSNSTDTQLAAVNDKLADAPTQAAFNDILESVAPTVDGGAIVSVFETSVQSLDVNNNRLAAVRSGDTGASAGNMGQGVTAWIQGFGQLADQDARDGVDGYEADTYGIAVGVDSENFSDSALIGLALSYANTEVDSDNITSTNSDIDSYQITLYGDYDFDDATYVAGNLGYASNTIDQVRNDVGTISGLNASSDYDSQQYIAYLEAGRDYAVGSGVLTPNVNAQYQHIEIDGYTETGAGGANLVVGDQDLDVLELGIGAQMKWDVATPGGNKLVPAIHAGYSYDLIGDDIQTTSTFTGGGASFSTNGADPARSSLNAGASLSLFTQGNMEVTGSYDYEYKEDYSANAAYIRAGVKF